MAKKRVSEFEKLKAAAAVIGPFEMPELIADIVGELLEAHPSDLGEAIRQRLQDEDRPTGRRLAELSGVAVALHEAGLIDVSGGLATAKQTGAAQLRRRTLPAYPVQAERVIAVAQGVEEMDDAVGRVTLADEVFSQRQAAHLEAQKGEAAEIARMRAEAEAAIREFPPGRGCGIGTFLTGDCFSIFWSVSRGMSVRAAWEQERRAEQRNQSSSAPERAKRQMMAATAILYVRLLDAGYFATPPKPLPTGPKAAAKFCREIQREYDTTPPDFVKDEADEPEEPVVDSESPDFEDEDAGEEVAEEIARDEAPAEIVVGERFEDDAPALVPVVIPEVIGGPIEEGDSEPQDGPLPAWLKKIGTGGAILTGGPGAAEVTAEEIGTWLWGLRWTEPEGEWAERIGIVHPDRPDRFGALRWGDLYAFTVRIERRRPPSSAVLAVAVAKRIAELEAEGAEVDEGIVRESVSLALQRRAPPATALIPVLWRKGSGGGAMYVPAEAERIASWLGWRARVVGETLPAEAKRAVTVIGSDVRGSPDRTDYDRPKAPPLTMAAVCWTDFLLWLWSAREQLVRRGVQIAEEGIGIEYLERGDWRRATVGTRSGLVEVALGRSGRIWRISLSLAGTAAERVVIEHAKKDGSIRITKIVPGGAEKDCDRSDLVSCLWSRMEAQVEAAQLVEELIGEWAGTRGAPETWAPVLESARAKIADALHQFLFDPKTGQGFLFAPEHAPAKVAPRLALPAPAERSL